mmetsp:Transcript_52151/g.113022  ORF Transcript_52151/g.113022 Transcript_52151/m.113022 type:complete len:354 (-) Transcript_52151:332-1393(-)
MEESAAAVRRCQRCQSTQYAPARAQVVLTGVVLIVSEVLGGDADGSYAQDHHRIKDPAPKLPLLEAIRQIRHRLGSEHSGQEFEEPDWCERIKMQHAIRRTIFTPGWTQNLWYHAQREDSNKGANAEELRLVATRHQIMQARVADGNPDETCSEPSGAVGAKLHEAIANPHIAHCANPHWHEPLKEQGVHRPGYEGSALRGCALNSSQQDEAKRHGHGEPVERGKPSEATDYCFHCRFPVEVKQLALNDIALHKAAQHEEELHRPALNDEGLHRLRNTQRIVNEDHVGHQDRPHTIERQDKRSLLSWSGCATAACSRPITGSTVHCLLVVGRCSHNHEAWYQERNDQNDANNC